MSPSYQQYAFQQPEHILHALNRQQREARNPDNKIVTIKNSGSVALRLAKIPFFQKQESVETVCYFFE
eukprot:8627657-Ditylum_brightwellii.AAC.1